MSLQLDERLATDCHVLGRLPLCQLLLMNNTGVRWLILVPETEHTEVCDLDPDTRSQLWNEVQLVTEFVRWHFAPDKINTAAIGNVVEQLHGHVVGRFHDDYSWPDVVWGRSHAGVYTAAEIATIKSAAEAYLKDLA